MNRKLILFVVLALMVLPQFVFAQGSGLTLTKLTAPASTGLTSGPLQAWAPNSTYFAIGEQNNPSAFAWYKNNGGVFTKLTNPSGLPTARPMRSVSWSPDGSLLLIMTDSGANPCAFPFYRTGDTLNAISSSNFDNQALCTSAGLDQGVSWRPSGGAVAIGMQLSPHLSVWTVAGSGASTTFTKWTSLTGDQLGGSGGRSVDWSDDSSLILECGDSGGTNGRLQIVRTSGNAFVVESRPSFDRSSIISFCDLDPTSSLITTGWGSNSHGVVHFNTTSNVFTSLTYPGPPYGGSVGGMRWDKTGTFIMECGAGASSSPFAQVVKRTGTGTSATFANLANPASLPDGACTGSNARSIQWTTDNAYVSIQEAASPWVVVYATDIGTVPPGQPTLSANFTITGNALQRCLVVWTTPSAGLNPIQGYNLSILNEYNMTSVIALGLVNSYLDVPSTQNHTYTVHAWNADGNGAESAAASCRIPPVPFYGPNGILYGGDRARLATAFGTSTTALDLLYGLLIILLMADLFALFMPSDMKLWGGVVGAIGGLFVAIAFGMIPLYAVLFLLVIVASVYFIVNRMTNKEE